MLFGYLTLFTALIISLSAAVYSILGLTAIFAAAFWPIVVLGGSLEFGKIVTTLWLHKYWDRAEIQYKMYLCSAVVILMVLTSMGVFGFLSKAHLDQAVPSGDVAAKVAIYDEKIKTERDNIDAARRALQQMDSQVDARLSRGDSEQSAERAVQIRRGQAKERAKLQKEISDAQNKISKLNEERAPIASEMRKVEAEVGPIKYIAALVYGDNPEANTLEKAVRWVIILIVIVFDPLALTLLLAATKTFEWERKIDIFAPKRRAPEYEPDDGQLTDDQIDQIRKTAKDDLPTGTVITKESLFPEELEPEPIKKYQTMSGLDLMWDRKNSLAKKDTEAEHAPLANISNNEDEDDHIDGTTTAEKEAQRAWKDLNPGETIKKHRLLYESGRIDKLPWDSPEYYLGLEADNVPHGIPSEVRGFGSQFPLNPTKGNMFLKTDQLPSALYKFNGTDWIKIDKDLSDNYAYDNAYIDHLIAKLVSGEYDVELLSEAERNRIEDRLNKG